MLACKLANTSVKKGLKLCILKIDRGRYQRLVGRLLCLDHTRSNLAYAMSIISLFMHNTGEQHMNAITRILKHLKSSSEKEILFIKNTNKQKY